MINLRPVIRTKVFRVCPQCRAYTTPSTQHLPKPSDRRERRPSQKLPTTPARTRFAPSPTGYLHLGSLRTALFNFLLAKATGGQFLLRVEDTDQKRTVADAEERIYQDLRWAGLQWDEGPDKGGPYGPYKQSERTLLYQEHAASLLDTQHAYRCFCTSRVGLVNEGLGGVCGSIPRALSDERATNHESHAIRLRMSKHDSGYTDLVYGVIKGARGPQRANKLSGQGCFADPVLLKSDGFPTYHLANVVDDHHMEITHVIRAVEWMPSTPKHVAMYEAFGWNPPQYAHVGLLQNNERQKYSKRRGDAELDMRSLAMSGVFPEALINYVALHGWSHDLGDDFLRIDDLIKNFDLRFTKGNTVIVPTKLGYFQRKYAEKYVEERGTRFGDMVESVLSKVTDTSRATDRTLICPTEELRPRVIVLLQLEAKKYTFPQEFFDRISYFFFSESRSKDDLPPFHPLILEHVGNIYDSISSISHGHWDISSLSRNVESLYKISSDNELTDLAESNDMGRAIRSQLQSFLRWAVSYGHAGPTILPTMQLLGREVTLERLREAIALLENPNQESRTSAPI